jgi:hypothetical protein
LHSHKEDFADEKNIGGERLALWGDRSDLVPGCLGPLAEKRPIVVCARMKSPILQRRIVE